MEDGFLSALKGVHFSVKLDETLESFFSLLNLFENKSESPRSELGGVNYLYSAITPQILFVSLGKKIQIPVNYC